MPRKDNDDHNLSFPMLPVKAFLKAKGSQPPKTWSSNLYSKLQEDDRQEWNNFALRTQEWILEDIKKHCLDPKLSDDGIGGGDWFMSYLREAHREM